MRILYFIILLFISQIAFSQSKEKIQKQSKEIKEQLRVLNKLLLSNKKNSKLSASTIRYLNAKISERNKLLSSLESELSNIDNDIENEGRAIKKLSEEMNTLRTQYVLMIKTMYKQSKMNKSLYSSIFFSKDLVKIYQKMKYINKSAGFRKSLYNELQIKQQKVKKKQDNFILYKKQKIKIKTAHEVASKKLEKEKKEKRLYVKELKKQEGKLKREIEKKEKKRLKLEEKLKKIIKAEIRKSSKNLKTKKADVVITESLISEKGKLAPPIKGKLISKFGVHNHPIVTTVKIQNSGIDIASVKKQKVKAIFRGKISSIIISNTNHSSIIIKHGVFYSVYSNIVNLKVKKGDKVKQGDILGDVALNNDGNYILQFQMWENDQKVDPQTWIEIK